MPRIVLHPHPALRYQSRPVTEIDDELRASVRTMFELMYQSRGIGLAANQVALPFRFFVLNITADSALPEEERVFINPVIVKRHASIEDEEGCLSFPGLYSRVQRAKKIRVRAFDLGGTEFEVEAEDLLSRAIQHEIDHLDGKLFIDYAGRLAKLTLNGRLKEMERQFRQAQQNGSYPSDDVLRQRLAELTTPSLKLAQPEDPPTLVGPSQPQPEGEPAV